MQSQKMFFSHFTYLHSLCLIQLGKDVTENHSFNYLIIHNEDILSIIPKR